MLSSVFPMKNPTAYGKGLSSDSANVVAATFLDRNNLGADGPYLLGAPRQSLLR